MSKKQLPEERDAGAASGAVVWRFGPFELDEGRRELRRDSQPVVIEPKPLDFLALLLRAEGKLVRKGDLIDTLWAGRIVTDSVMTQCAAKLRAALGDEAQQSILTVHGHGYRFGGDARRIAPGPSPAMEAEPALGAGGKAALAIPPAREPEIPPDGVAAMRLRWFKIRAPVLAAAAASVLVTGLWHLSRDRAPPDRSIAVLPFANLSADPAADDYLAGGLHDNIIAHLARINNLKVISRTSVMRYRDEKTDVKSIGEALRVGHVLEGSVQRVGNRVRVNAQLIETATDHHMWAEIYDRDISDLFKLQSELAERVAETVGARMTRDELSAIRRNPTESREAYELYLKARVHERAGAINREHLFQAQAILERAVAEDPEFALAHAALSRVHTLMYWFAFDPAVERREQARAAAERALELNPNLPEGHLSQGLYRAGGFRDYAGALESYQKALALQPSSSEIHQRIGSAYRRQGRWDEALASFARALELDPANATLLEDVAGLYRGLRRYKEAAPLYERVVELAPDEIRPRITQAMLLFDWKGDLAPLRNVLGSASAGADSDAAVSWTRYLLAMWEERYPDAIGILTEYPVGWLPVSGGSRIPKENALGIAHELAGDKETAQHYYRRARVLLEAEIRSRPNSPYEHLARAMVLAGLGEHDLAMHAAQRSLDLVPASVDPVTHADLAIQTALVYMKLGDRERTLAELERLIKVPFGPSVHHLRTFPYWKPLRGEPRFEALIAANLPRE